MKYYQKERNGTKMIRKKLDDLKNKFTERANTLFTSMKDNLEKDYGVKTQSKNIGLGRTKETDESELSSLVDREIRKEYAVSAKDEEMKKEVLEEEKKKIRRADLLYPTRKDKEEKKEENFDKINIKKEEKIDEIKEDVNFNKFLKYLYPREGGYSDRKEHLGGKTNLGVTQSTFDWYNKKNNIPIKDVKNITKEEATKIYYDYFWKETGASDIKDKKLALMYFDAAINHGPYYAKKYYKESNGNFDEFMELRKKHYKRMAEKIPNQNKNYNGWINRLNHLKNFSEELQ